MSNQFFHNHFKTNSPQNQQNWNEWVLDSTNQNDGSNHGIIRGHVLPHQPGKEKLPVGYLIAVIILCIIIVVQIIVLLGILQPSSSAHMIDPNEASYFSSIIESNETVEMEKEIL